MTDERRLDEIRLRAYASERFASGLLPAALGYTEAGKYARWHAQDSGFLLAEVERLEKENKRLRESIAAFEKMLQLQKSGSSREGEMRGE